MPPSRLKALELRLGVSLRDPSQRHKALYFLGELLGLNSRQFAELKGEFRELTSIHFDIDEVGRTQTEALEMAITDLKSTFPAWFTKGHVEETGFLARRVFFSMQIRRRKYRNGPMKKDRKKSEKGKNDARSSTENHSQENSESGLGSLRSAEPGPAEPEPAEPGSAKPGPSLTQRMEANLLSIKNGSHAPKIFASPPRALHNVESSSSYNPVRLPLSHIQNEVNVLSIKNDSHTPKIFASPPRALRNAEFSSSNNRDRSPLSDMLASSGSISCPQSPVPPPKTPNANPDAGFSSSSISELGVPRTQIPPSSHDSSHIYRSRAFGGKTSFFTPVTPSSPIVASSSRSASCGDTQGCSAAPLQNVAQIQSVHDFLGAVAPPMTHLLHRFIEFGCLGEDFLFAVSTWKPEGIRAFLKSLPPGPGGSTLTKMEIEILAHHFESYFLASKS